MLDIFDGGAVAETILLGLFGVQGTYMAWGTSCPGLFRVEVSPRIWDLQR